MLKLKRKDALALVESASRLITEIWFRPDCLRDSTDDLRAFEANFGNDYLLRIRNRVDEHLTLIERICIMDDNDALALEECTGSAASRSWLAREHSVCVLARKTVDKPNVHRLRELVLCTLPMLGHVSAVGELPLEKTHQGLKTITEGLQQKGWAFTSNRERDICGLAGAIDAIGTFVNRMEQFEFVCVLSSVKRT